MWTFEPDVKSLMDTLSYMSIQQVQQVTGKWIATQHDAMNFVALERLKGIMAANTKNEIYDLLLSIQRGATRIPIWADDAENE
jgi:hypothetical protein